MDHKMSDPPFSSGSPKILSAHPTDEKTSDTLNEQDQSRGCLDPSPHQLALASPSPRRLPEGVWFPCRCLPCLAPQLDPAAAALEPAAVEVHPAAAALDPAAAELDPAAVELDPAAAVLDPVAAVLQSTVPELDPAAASLDPARRLGDPRERGCASQPCRRRRAKSALLKSLPAGKLSGQASRATRQGERLPNALLGEARRGQHPARDPSRSPGSKIFSADSMDEKMSDTLNEQDQSRSPSSKLTTALPLEEMMKAHVAALAASKITAANLMDQKMSDPPSNSSKMPSADPTDDKMLNEQDLSRAPGSKLLTFDASVVNAFIVKQEWGGLDDYLGKLVATILKKTPGEVAMMHPGLFMIPREEGLLDILSDQKFEEADAFFQKSVELLRGCHGRFIGLDLMHKIDDLNTLLKTRSTPAIRRSTECIEASISDYIHLYFPGAIRRGNNNVEGLWQFAIKQPKLDKQARRHAFRCLACGWICPGSRSISHMRLHIVQSQDCEGCSKVTEDMLDRLKSIDETKDVPTFETVKYLSRNRKTMSESVASAPDTQLESLLSGEVSSATGANSLSSTSVKDKKARKEPIGATNSTAKKMKPQLADSQAPMMSSYPDADRKHLRQMVQVLKSETVALAGQINASVAPEARLFFLEKLCALQQVAVDLSSFVLNAIVDVPVSAPDSSSAPVPEDDGGHSE